MIPISYSVSWKILCGFELESTIIRVDITSILYSIHKTKKQKIKNYGNRENNQTSKKTKNK